ncbi:GNAT family N-acetyltransferase [Deinococcus planocerae]|uniref:GNAT family N-acetyltransferase n=1 Tax=Deinococcus planocerae TaxID=1737569 RepID=UPI000C7F32DE|nr:GNAT family N-acetyltransferase [Deinococcus planocerae]
MSSLPPVAVQPVSGATRSAVLALRVHPRQAVFSGEMPELLAQAEADPRSVAMCVLEGGEVVGYFRLDPTPGAVARRDFGPGSVGVRAFFIDRERQGRGLGTAAMLALAAWLREHRPEVRRVILTVNFKNPAATRAYREAGFVIRGAPYLGGSVGPQHVMELELGELGR